MSVFININPQYLADKIHSAKSRVVYISAGLDEVIASSLINISNKIGVDNVSVLLDVSENALRFGYGNIAGITLLKENKLPIKDASGIRIGALIYDNKGLIFAPTPLLIEAGKKDSSQPNAIQASLAQIKDIISAAISSKKNTKQIPEIGVNKVSQEQIENVEDSVNKNPPQKFDVARKVQVFTTELEFIEVKLVGCEIQRHTVPIPSELLVGNADEKTKKQLKTGFNIIEKGSDLSGDSIRDELKEIKKAYIKSIPKYGNVILKSKSSGFYKKIKELEGKVAEFQIKIKANLEQEIEKSKAKLMGLLTPAVKSVPPYSLLRQVHGDTPTEAEVERYLKQELDRIFPSAKDLIKAMSVSCINKAITYGTISNEGFQHSVSEAYPVIDWNKMFEEYDAAPESK